MPALRAKGSESPSRSLLISSGLRFTFLKSTFPRSSRLFNKFQLTFEVGRFDLALTESNEISVEILFEALINFTSEHFLVL
jgi:hypothetical protein